MHVGGGILYFVHDLNSGTVPYLKNSIRVPISDTNNGKRNLRLPTDKIFFGIELMKCPLLKASGIPLSDIYIYYF